MPWDAIGAIATLFSTLVLVVLEKDRLSKVIPPSHVRSLVISAIKSSILSSTGVGVVVLIGMGYGYIAIPDVVFDWRQIYGYLYLGAVIGAIGRLLVAFAVYADKRETFLPKAITGLDREVVKKERMELGVWRVNTGPEPTSLFSHVGERVEDGAWAINLENAGTQGIYGPYRALQPGTYLVCFYLKINKRAGNIDLGLLDVVSRGVERGDNPIEKEYLNSSRFPEDDKYEPIVIEFVLKQVETDVEFRYKPSGTPINRIVTLKYVFLEKIK